MERDPGVVVGVRLLLLGWCRQVRRVGRVGSGGEATPTHSPAGPAALFGGCGEPVPGGAGSGLIAVATAGAASRLLRLARARDVPHIGSPGAITPTRRTIGSMVDDDDDDYADVVALETLEKEMGVPEGFFKNLGREDDWSFIVKLHALIESALTHELVASLDDERLRGFVSKLNLRSGKLALASALERISKENRAFAEGIASIRNELVHDARNANFTLTKRFESLPDHKVQSIYRGWGFREFEELFNEQLREYRFVDVFRVTPKFVFHLRSFLFFQPLYLKSEWRRWKASPSTGLAEALAKKFAKDR